MKKFGFDLNLLLADPENDPWSDQVLADMRRAAAGGNVTGCMEWLQASTDAFPAGGDRQCQIEALVESQGREED